MATFKFLNQAFRFSDISAKILGIGKKVAQISSLTLTPKIKLVDTLICLFSFTDPQLKNLSLQTGKKGHLDSGINKY